ncbi:MAG: PulJ/GspJ family protein [Ilumatobacteraceae bacterium]
MHRSRRTTSLRGVGDRGFTLIELLVSLTLIGIIATVVASTIVITLRANPVTEERTDVARTLQGLVTWLPQDVDSTPPTGFTTTASAPSGCTTSQGTNLLLLQWTEKIYSATTTFVANYRHWTNSKGESFITRTTCRGTGAKPLGNTVVALASAPLPALPAGWNAGDSPIRVTISREDNDDVSLVEFEVTTLDGKVLTIDSAPKNPAHTLAPFVVATSTTVAGTTTSTTSTTVAGTTTTVQTTTTTVPACAILTSSLPASVFNTSPNGNGRSSTNVGVLQTALTVTVTTNGRCAGLEARPSTGAPNSELFRNFTTTDGITFTVTFPGYDQGSSEMWADGSRTISLYTPLGGPFATLTVQIR